MTLLSDLESAEFSLMRARTALSPAPPPRSWWQRILWPPPAPPLSPREVLIRDAELAYLRAIAHAVVALATQPKGTQS